MPGVTRCNDDTAVGTIRPLQTAWKLDGEPIAVVGCPVDSHTPCELPSPPHCAATMAEGADYWSIGGTPICRAGDMATCGHPATGQPAWRID